jgi:prolipoprotein diacylglyceryl transferase
MLLASFPSPPVGGLDLGFTQVRVYGILIATAVLVAATWTRRRYERWGGDGELADRVTIWAVVVAFVGARLAYVAPRIQQFADDPLGIVQIWEGGLALFGGLTFGLVTLLVLLRRWGGDRRAFFDALAPALPLAQAIGRWGNYFNQELYGTPTDLPWAVEIDQPVARYAGFDTFHPTFLYESLANLVLVAVILRLQRRGRLRKGSLILVYAVGYGIIRFLLELIRTDTEFRLLGLSRNAFVALAFVLVGLLLLRRLQRRVDDPPVGAPVEERRPGGAADAPVAGPAEDADDAEDVSGEPDESSAVLVDVARPSEPASVAAAGARSGAVVAGEPADGGSGDGASADGSSGDGGGGSGDGGDQP